MAAFLRYTYLLTSLALLTFVFQNCGDSNLASNNRVTGAGVVNEGDVGLSLLSRVDPEINSGKVLSAKIEDGEFIVSFYKGIKEATSDDGDESSYNDHWFFVVNGTEFAWIRDAEECGGPLVSECTFNFGHFSDIDALDFRRGLAVNISLITVSEDGSRSKKGSDSGVQILIPERDSRR